MRLFAGAPPFSRKAHFEPASDMRQVTRLRCHVRMYGHWGRAGENRLRQPEDRRGRAPGEGGIALSDAHGVLAERCMTAIMSAQVGRPRRRASAEGPCAMPRHGRPVVSGIIM